MAGISGNILSTEGLVVFINPADKGCFKEGNSNLIDLSTSQSIDKGGVGFSTASGGSFTFDGAASSKFEIPNSPHLVSDQTLLFWVYPTDRSQRRNWYNQAYGGEGSITYEKSGTLSYYHGTSGTNSAPYQGFSASGSPLSTLNTWYFVSLVRHISGGNSVTWYINGQINASKILTDTNVTASSFNILIGRGYTSYGFIGKLGLVAIYNKALTSEEVLNYYNNTKKKIWALEAEILL